MVLHNYIREHSSGDVNFVNCNQDPNFVSTIPDRYNKYAVSFHASDDSTFEACFFTMDDVGVLYLEYRGSPFTAQKYGYDRFSPVVNG
jgi:transposase InsO family protein